MNKPFFKTDGLTINYDTIDISTMDEQYPTFNRIAFLTKAHLGVNKEDILDEVKEIEENIQRGRVFMTDQILTTTLTNTTNFVFALTYDGFVKLALETTGKYLTNFERYEMIAAQLIRNRDDMKCGAW